MSEDTQRLVAALVDGWTVDPGDNREGFLRLKSHLEALGGVRLEFKSRPGISHSLRAAHERQAARPVFTLVDVIDDDQDNRWLSVCFYAEMIDDPEDLGDHVPEGLMGEDAVCFDVDAWDEALLAYIEARMDEAHAHAAGHAAGEA